MGAAQTESREVFQLEFDTAPIADSLKPDVSAGNELKAYAESYEIVDQDSADSFAGWRNELDAREKRIIERLAPAKKAAHEAHRRICDLESDAIRPLREAKAVSNRKLGAYQLERERFAEQERRRLEAEAKRIEEEHRIAVATELEAAGEHEQAAQVLEEPIVTAPAPVAKPTVAGVQFREQYEAEITDLGAFLKAVAATKALHGLVLVNSVALNGMARAQRENLSIPGVKVVKKKIVATGRH